MSLCSNQNSFRRKGREEGAEFFVHSSAPGTFHKLLSTAVSELGDELLVASFLDVVTAKIDGALAEVSSSAFRLDNVRIRFA